MLDLTASCCFPILYWYGSRRRLQPNQSPTECKRQWYWRVQGRPTNITSYYSLPVRTVCVLTYIETKNVSCVICFAPVKGSGVFSGLVCTVDRLVQTGPPRGTHVQHRFKPTGCENQFETQHEVCQLFMYISCSAEV